METHQLLPKIASPSFRIICSSYSIRVYLAEFFRLSGKVLKFFPIHKSGNKHEANNYHPIAILSIISKSIFAKLISELFFDSTVILYISTWWITRGFLMSFGTLLLEAHPLNSYKHIFGLVGAVPSSLWSLLKSFRARVLGNPLLAVYQGS